MNSSLSSSNQCFQTQEKRVCFELLEKTAPMHYIKIIKLQNVNKSVDEILGEKKKVCMYERDLEI